MKGSVLKARYFTRLKRRFAKASHRKEIGCFLRLTTSGNRNVLATFTIFPEEGVGDWKGVGNGTQWRCYPDFDNHIGKKENMAFARVSCVALFLRTLC
jgi:hypothetical protein